MNEELRTRVLTAAAAETSPTRAAVNRRNTFMGMVAAASGLGAFMLFAGFVSEGELVRLGGELAPHQHLERSVWP